MNAKLILREIVDIYGRNIISEKQKLNAIISDLIHDNKKLRILLELSIRGEIPNKISTLLNGKYIYNEYTDEIYYSMNTDDFEIKLKLLENNFKEDFSLEMNAVKEIVNNWIYALEPEPCSYGITDPLIIFYTYIFQDWKGKKLSEVEYESIEKFSEGLALVGKEDWIESDAEFYMSMEEPYYPDVKYGFVNRNGEEVIPTKYSSAESFNNGLALVSLDGKRGYIDRKGNWVKDKQ